MIVMRSSFFIHIHQHYFYCRAFSLSRKGPEASFIEQLIAYTSAAPHEAAFQALSNQANLDLTPVLPQLMMPAVVVHGRYDQARPLAHAEWLVKYLPHAELFLVDASHTPMVEAPSEVERAVQHLDALVRTAS